MPKTKWQKTFDKAWVLMSKYVRQRDSDWRGMITCISCGVYKPINEMHAGHYRHKFLDFDEQNVNGQCAKCNTYQGGKLDQYTLGLMAKYGDSVIKEIDERRKEQLWKQEQTGKRYSLEELENIILDLKQKVK